MINWVEEFPRTWWWLQTCWWRGLCPSPRAARPGVTLAGRWPGFPGAIWQGLVRVRAGGPAGGPQFAQFGDVVVEGAGADAEQLRDGFPPRVAPRPSRVSQHPDEAGRKRRRWSKDAVPSSGTTTLSFWRVALRGERDFHPFDGVCFQGRIRGRQAGTPRRYASY
jgi:hypothetical protein